MNRISSIRKPSYRQRRMNGSGARESGSSSLARVTLSSFACALLLISLYAALMVQPACAATWPLPTSGLSATLGFHQSYTAGVKSYVHSGIDIPASAGMQISSPLAGTVRFTGAVPSGDSRTGGTSSQQTMNAVSIETQCGRVITLMPLATIQVHEGQHVAEGTVLGSLAASGDVSTAVPHLHMGYKDGATYLDPMELFGAVASDGAFQGAYAASSALGLQGDAGSAASSGGLAAGNSAIVDGAAQDAPGAVPGEDAERLSYVIPSERSEQGSLASAFGTIATGDYELRQTPEDGTLPVPESITAALESLVGACYGQLVALADALAGISQVMRIPLSALYAGCVFLALGGLVASGAFVVRRYGSRLRQLLAQARGGVMHGAKNAKSLLVPGLGR